MIRFFNRANSNMFWFGSNRAHVDTRATIDTRKYIMARGKLKRALRTLSAAIVGSSLCAVAHAAVYAPVLTGALDPTLTFIGSPGYTSVGTSAGLRLDKPIGLSAGEGVVYTSVKTDRNFDAVVRIDRTGLGNVGLDFAAYDSTVKHPISTNAGPGFDIFSNGPGDIQAYSIDGVRTDTFNTDPEVILELRRTGSLYEQLLNGAVVNSGAYSASHPFTFLLSLCAETCIAGNDNAARYGVVESFTVTTPGVPEPANWMMMIAGFGMIGALNRYLRRLYLAQ